MHSGVWCSERDLRKRFVAWDMHTSLGLGASHPPCLIVLNVITSVAWFPMMVSCNADQAVANPKPYHTLHFALCQQVSSAHERDHASQYLDAEPTI